MSSACVLSFLYLMCVDYMISSKWIIKSYDAKTQSVTPVTATKLQAAWGSGFVTFLPAGAYVWTIRNSDTGYTYVFVLLLTIVTKFTHAPSNSIQDGGVTVFWGTNHAIPNAQVTIGAGTGHVQQRWILKRILT
jgi:hypothetical protein